MGRSGREPKASEAGTFRVRGELQINRLGFGAMGTRDQESGANADHSIRNERNNVVAEDGHVVAVFNIGVTRTDAAALKQIESKKRTGDQWLTW